MSFVYVIGPAEGPYKIGITINLIQRLAALQTANAHELSIHFSYESDDAFRIETSVHRTLAAQQLNGEWYDAKLSTIISAIEHHDAPQSPMEAFDPPNDAKALREWRNILSLSLDRAAQKLGCSKSTLIAYERGRRIPKYFSFACVAIALDLKPYGELPE